MARNIKGTGTQDYNCVKVIWFDRPRFGESPADIHHFLNCPFNFKLNYKFLAVQCKKLWNLRKAFENRRVKILCSYSITDFSELRQELLKAGQSQLAGFEIRHMCF
jgi:hypothetical protein